MTGMTVTIHRAMFRVSQVALTAPFGDGFSATFGHLAGALYSAHVQERGFLEAEKRGIVGKACDVRFQREGGRACRWVGKASERRLSMLVSGANRRKGETALKTHRRRRRRRSGRRCA